MHLQQTGVEASPKDLPVSGTPTDFKVVGFIFDFADWAKGLELCDKQ
jgi:hypothetical protein